MKPGLDKVVARIPKPVTHIAEDQNPVDFLLLDGQTLSVKSNMRAAGKVAPQNIGQPTAYTFWRRLPQFVPGGVDISRLPYGESARLFKQVAQTETSALLAEYWKNLFDCDYLIYVCNVLDQYDGLTSSPTVRLYAKTHSPDWHSSRITFSRSVSDWNESCTVKYDACSIGEFQIHNNRDCFKFRFNLKGLIEAGLL